MSWQAIAWTYQQDKTSTTTQTLLLLYLAGRHNADSGECFVALSTIETDLNMHRKTICRGLKQLQDLGCISKRDSSRKCNTYVIHWTEVQAKNKHAKPDNSASDIRTPERCHQDTSTSDTRTPPSESPSESPSNHQTRVRDPSELVLPDWLDPNVWQAFCDHRKEIRKAKRVPWTLRAAGICLGYLKKCREQGVSPETAVETCIANGWTAPQPKYFERAKNSAWPKRYNSTTYSSGAPGVNLDFSQAHVGESMEAFQRRMAAEQSRGEPESDLQKQIWGR